MKKILFFIIALILSGIFYSCEDFLEQQPIGAFNEDPLQTKEGIEKLLIGAYTTLKGENSMRTPANMPLFGSIHGGEAFKGSNAGDTPEQLEVMKYAIGTGSSQVQVLWTHYFDAVFRCNLVLKYLQDVSEITPERKKTVEAEVRFLRAHYYFILKINFKNIPWIDETTEDPRVPNTENNDGVNYVNIWPQITADMDFARKNLPETQKDLGRPNKWAAEAYYAKILMYRAGEGEYPAGYEEALIVWNDVINNGKTMKGVKYALEPNYWYNFDVTRENGQECVFSVQYSVQDGTTPGYSMSAELGNCFMQWATSQRTNGPGKGGGIGFFQPTPYNVDHFRTDPNGLPYLDMYETNSHRVKDDFGLTMANPFVPDTCGLDPRLDINVGRRGIPFLDFGSFSSTWIRDQRHGGPYFLKKWNIRSDEYATYANIARLHRTAMNIMVIRFADVLLLAAECEARVGSRDNARTLVNQIRNRMVTGTAAWVKNLAGTDYAANYRIGPYPDDLGPNDPFATQEGALNAILMERTLELNMEGSRFYDVKRFGKAEEIFNEWLAVDGVLYDYLKLSEYTASPDAYLPIPRRAIDNSQVEGKPTLTQNPDY